MQRPVRLDDRTGSFPTCLLVLASCLFLAATAWLPSLAWADEEAEDPEPIERDIETAREVFDEAETKREECSWDQAADLFWKAVDADLEHFLAHVRYQEASLKAGDTAKSLIDDYDSLVEDYPKHLGLKLHRLRLDPADARLPQLEALLKIHRQSFDVLLEIGRAQLALGEPKKAVQTLKKSLALKLGARHDVVLLLAEAEIAAGDLEGARKRLVSAVQGKPDLWQARLALARLDLLAGLYDKSREQAEVVLAQRPTWIAAFLVKSEALSGEGNSEAAKQVLRTVYDRITKDVPELNIALADLEAQFETEAGYKLALELYRGVIENDEENSRAYYGLAWVLERQEKYKEAEEAYREVMAIEPLSVMAVNSIGHCLFKQGRVSEAQVQFKRALDLEPTFVTALANLGATYDAQAKYSDAIKVYEKILRMKGQKDNLVALINCAFDHEANGSFPKAAKLLERAHKIVPEDANIMVWLGDNMYFQKRWKDAETWYQRAIAQDPESFFGWRGLGLAQGQRKRWADAVNAFEKAKKLKPDDVDIYLTLGDIYFVELNDDKNALKNYQEYVQRGGTSQEVLDIIAEIKKELEDG